MFMSDLGANSEYNLKRKLLYHIGLIVRILSELVIQLDFLQLPDFMDIFFKSSLRISATGEAPGCTSTSTHSPAKRKEKSAIKYLSSFLQ